MKYAKDTLVDKIKDTGISNEWWNSSRDKTTSTRVFIIEQILDIHKQPQTQDMEEVAPPHVIG